MRHYLGVLLAVILLAVPWFIINHADESKYITKAFEIEGDQLAAVVTHDPKSVPYLQAKYQSAGQNIPARKIRILIVPGHEPGYGGAEFRDVKERDLVVELADDLAGFLRQNSKYEVFVARTDDSWSDSLSSYFRDHWNDIIDWEKSYRAEMSRSIALGTAVQSVSKVYHNDAPEDVATRLFGITKWANENDIDVAIHVHLNDYKGHGNSADGEYSGFAIYVPANQYQNSTTTHAIADKIFDRLKKYNAVSDLPGESDGVVDEPDLIAIGAYNTADAASMLIEYGYIYETQFLNPDIRGFALKDLAYQTYLGLQDFFDPVSSSIATRYYDTMILPHIWASSIKADTVNPDAFALQTALLFDGVYPPGGKGMNECPRTGKIGTCTKASLEAFQKKYGIKGGEGNAGPKTIEELNRLYGLKVI